MYLDLFKEALSKVEQSYFHLKVTYGHNYIVRERIFCYELYHQLRLISDNDSDITLNAEPDKRFHNEIKRGDWRNPDFIIHKPGSWYDNAMICEVKGILNNKDTRGILKDIHTLIVYTEMYEYKAGLFILYNHKINELKNLLTKNKRKIKPSLFYDRISLLAVVSQGEVEGPINLAEVLCT